MSVFGEYFRSRREDLGISQKEAAERLGVSANTVARWERGSALPTAARVTSLRDLLGISRARIADLVRGTAPPPGAEAVEARIAELEDRIAELEERCVQPVTALEDQYGNKIVFEPAGIRIESLGEVEVVSATLEVVSSFVRMAAGMTKCDGALQSDTVITNSVVASSYTPGAGNVW